MTEKIKKIDDEKVEVKTTVEDEVVVLEKGDLLREIAECEEIIARDRRYLASLD